MAATNIMSSKKPLLIGLVGKAGSGKDTVRNLLVAYYNFFGYAFAEPMKTMLAVAGFPEPSRELKETTIPGFDFSYRKAGQALGTEWGRALDKDMWLKIGQRRIAATFGDGFNLVISDVRFLNEAEMIKQLGGVIVKVTGRAYDVANPGHISEVEQDQIVPGWLLDNSGSMGQLQDNLKRLINHLTQDSD